MLSLPLQTFMVELFAKTAKLIWSPWLLEAWAFSLQVTDLDRFWLALITTGLLISIVYEQKPFIFDDTLAMFTFFSFKKA